MNVASVFDRFDGRYMVGAFWFSPSQNRARTHPQRPGVHRGLAEFDASRLLAPQSLTLKAIRLRRDP
jgi:hypothetical protein